MLFQLISIFFAEWKRVLSYRRDKFEFNRRNIKRKGKKNVKISREGRNDALKEVEQIVTQSIRCFGDIFSVCFVGSRHSVHALKPLTAFQIQPVVQRQLIFFRIHKVILARRS